MFNFNNEVKAKLRIKTIPADKLTPIKILESLGAVALLESAYHETGKGKYSLMILDEAFTIYKINNKYNLRSPDGKNFTFNTNLKKFLSVLEEIRKKSPVCNMLGEIPIVLGGIGYLGYEFFSEIENINFKKQNDRELYENVFIFGRNFITFDHLHDEAIIVSVLYKNEVCDMDLDKEISDVEKRVKRVIVQEDENKSFDKISAKIVSKNDRSEYIENVGFIKKEIYKGNLLQCVLSRRIEIETRCSPIDAYRNLRMKNPSPYMFYLNFRDYVVFGTSPEVMVKVKNNKITVRPIAGTRKRGKDAAEDIELEKELINDIKEKAEHLMLIDLGRNDVGKVSVGGSVEVIEYMIIEKYSKVMHLVSGIEGTLEKRYNTNDAIYATVPAGTVTGAPKIQAIKTIEKLERYRRGPYAGVVGYFEADGSFDSCIAIRTAIYKNNKIWLQAGAGIVYDSVPEKEYEETQNKMMALLNAFNINIE